LRFNTIVNSLVAAYFLGHPVLSIVLCCRVTGIMRLYQRFDIQCLQWNDRVFSDHHCQSNLSNAAVRICREIVIFIEIYSLHYITRSYCA